MDKLDLDILKHLSKNGRISHEELGKLLSLSRPAIHKRIKKLEEEGIIKNYKAVINWSLLGYDIQSLIYLKINSSNFILSTLFKE